MAAVLVATLLPGLVQYLVEKHPGITGGDRGASTPCGCPEPLQGTGRPWVTRKWKPEAMITTPSLTTR